MFKGRLDTIIAILGWPDGTIAQANDAVSDLLEKSVSIFDLSESEWIATLSELRRRMAEIVGTLQEIR